ncbi:MAG: ribonuclease Z [Bacteroidales bacterium]|nr:ribonuclease Z [Bacteroidales bacterium]
MENFSVTILGSSSASPTRDRNTSAQLINYSNRFYLIDCGEGTQMQLRKNKVRISKIHHILISHLHGDHFFGLIGLLSSQSLFGRKKDLHLYADFRIQEIIDLQLKISETVLQFEIIYHPLNFSKKTTLFEDKKLKISSFPLDHRVPTCGFVFQEKKSLPNINKSFVKKHNPSIEQIKDIRSGNGFTDKDGYYYNHEKITISPYKPRSFAYCSDTKYFDTLSQNFNNIELLYSECTFMKDFQKIAEDKYHLTTADCAKIATEANVGRLIVGHFSARYKEILDLKDELTSLYPDAEVVRDNQIFHIRETK